MIREVEGKTHISQSDGTKSCGIGQTKVRTQIQLYYYTANQISGAHAHKYDIVQRGSY